MAEKNYVSLDKLALFLDKVKVLIPSKTSDISNDSGFITNAVNNLLNYYTKKEVTDLIDALKTIQFEVVDSLPATGQGNIIYLVPAASGSGQNIYDEYAWIESTSKFEKIGSTDIDLSGYWSKTELVEVTNDQINSLFT